MLSRFALGLTIGFCLIGSAQATPALDWALQPADQTVGFSEAFSVKLRIQTDTAVATAHFDVDYRSDLINATSTDLVDLESMRNFFPKTGTSSSSHISRIAAETAE